MRRAPVVLAVLLVAVVGCADPGEDLPADARVTIDTVDGVPHVISGNRGAWVRGRSWKVLADSGLIIGEADGTEPYVFGQVTGVVLGDDRRIYVGDGQALEVRVFSPDGAFQTRFDHEGAGPGEFRDISGLARAPDGIAVLDGAQDRVSVFSTDGAFLRSFRLHRPDRAAEAFAVMGFDTSGRFLDRARLSAAPTVDSVGVTVHSLAGEPADTVFIAAIEEDPLVVERDGVPVASLPRPYAPRPSVAIGPDGRIYFTRGDHYRVMVISPAGDTLRILRRELRPRQVSAEERDSARAVLEGMYHRGDAPAPADVDLPETRPLISALHVDRLGNLWVGAAPGRGWRHREWAVHDSTGRYLGPVATPDMTLADIGEDYVAGVMADETGVQRVVVFPLVR